MKTAIVTGASSGIGLSIAEKLKNMGYTVYGLCRRSVPVDGIKHISTDVTDDVSINNAIEKIVSESGKIDLLITCAGMGVSGAVEFISDDDMRKQFDVNLFGTVKTVKAAIPYMRKEKSGRIICISSVAGVYSIPFQAYYSMSKAAINSFVDALSNELRQFNISICAVMPGDIKTGFTSSRKKTELGNEEYNGVILKSVSKMEKDEMNGMNPSAVSDLVIKLSEKKHISQLYTVGVSYKLLVFLSRILPHRMIVWILGKMY